MTSMLPFNETKLDKLAQLSVHTGLALEPGQDLLITAPAEALPLVRRIAVHVESRSRTFNWLVQAVYFSRMLLTRGFRRRSRGA